jgi:putative hydrolase of the HAD superfamily
MARVATTLQEMNFSVTPEELRKREYEVRIQIDRPEIVLSTHDASRWEIYVGLLLTGVGIPSTACPEIFKRLQAEHRQRNLWEEPIPGTYEALKTLQSMGLRLAVVSNADGRVAQLLESVDLAAPFEQIFDSEILGIEKPDPGIFQSVLNTLRLRPEEVIHVGDLYHVDVLGARAAGIHPFLVDPTGKHPFGDCDRVRDLQELTDRLQET